MTQPPLPIDLPRDLIALPANELLDQFGGGGHAPGSGSAAALMGLLSAQLIATVCKISEARANADAGSFAFVLDRLEQKIIPNLKRLFQKDAEDFDEVIRTRVKRDQEIDAATKRRLRDSALRRLQGSTDLVFEIGRLCLQLVDYALIVFDSGSKKVRGDSGAAISAALAGAMSSVFIINLNLRSFQGGRWAASRQQSSLRLKEDILNKQEDAFRRITTLQPQDISDVQPSFI
jgi:formiminotetrahydrofolate cyclodeaminase